MSWFQRIFGLEANGGTPPGPDADYWYEPYSGNGSVSVEDALSIPGFSSGKRYLSETLASMPIHIYRRNEDGGREVAKEHDSYSVIHAQPNELDSAFDFYRGVVDDTILYGGHLSLVEMNANQVVTSLEPFDMRHITLRQDQQTGVRVFFDSQKQRGYLDSQVLWIPGPFTTRWQIKSTLQVFAETLSAILIARRYVKGYFGKGGLGPVYAKFKQTMNPDVKKTWSSWFSANFGGARNAGRVPIMDGDSDLVALNVKHSDMQLTELQNWFIQELARILRVPNHKIQDLSRSTNNNIEHQGLEAVIDCIRPLATGIEKRLNLAVLGPRERMTFYSEFDLDGMLRGDSIAQAAIMQAEHNSAVRTPNEHRRLRNIARYPDPSADKLYTQGANVPIELAGQQQAAKKEQESTQ